MMLSFVLLLLISVFGRLATALGAADSLTPLCGDGARLSPPTSRGGGLRSSRALPPWGLLGPASCRLSIVTGRSLRPGRCGIAGGCSVAARPKRTGYRL